MSTFHHHLWFVRSRMGAWDHPTRSHKKFIDIHCEANDDLDRIFLPKHLGWWAVKTWSGAQGEPTFADDIEYLCCKCIATGAGFSIMGVDPYNISKIPVYQRLGAIMRQYEELRRANYFPESIKAKLRVPGDEFTLIQTAEGKWQFQPVQYANHKVEGINGWSNIWHVKNKFSRQPLQLRIEALMSAGPYDAPGNVTLADFSDPSDFPDRATAQDVTADLKLSPDQAKGIYSATSTRRDPISAWAKTGKQFSPPLNLSGHQALGVWVYGDGQGEVLNFQLKSPEHISGGIGDHYVIVDFTGWRYFELIEPEGERYSQYSWPYGWAYAIYRESVNYNYVESLSVWYNNLPPNKQVICYLSPIKALPLVNVKISNPAITVGSRTIVFPTEIESGYYLEFHSMSDCRLYGHRGELICEVVPQGEVPVLEEGDNEVRLTCDASGNVSARAKVTIISVGKTL